MQKIIVLLSVYNGTAYLRELLDSVFAQQGIAVEVLARNDGSQNPETEEILAAYSHTHPLTFYTGENLGAARSFYDLIEHAPDAPYYAFADQDDHWMPDKLLTGVEALHKVTPSKQPLLYFCNYNLSDSQGHIIQNSIQRDLHITKGNALLESFAPGCSMVFNKALLQQVRHHLPPEPLIHDRWLFLTAIYFGQVVYDDTPHFNYRIHSGNVIGTLTAHEKATHVGRIFSSGHFSASHVAQLFLDQYRPFLSAADAATIQTCIDYPHRLSAMAKLLFSSTFRLAYGGLKRRTYWRLRILFKKV